MTDTNRDFSSVWDLETGFPYDKKNNIPAFFNLEDHTDEDEVKKWLDAALDILKTQNLTFTRKAVENLMFYKGVQHEKNNHFYNLEDANRFFSNNHVSINIIYEFVELYVNRMSQFKPNVTVTPSNNDGPARDSAEAKELAIKDYMEKNRIAAKLDDLRRNAYTLGEGFLHVYWDADKGPIHPAFSEIEKKFKGLQRVSTPGGDVNVNRKPRIGDVVVDVVPAIYVLYEERPWEHVEYAIVDIKTNIDKLRSDYPDIELKGDGDVSCYWFYHLPTKYLPEGRFIKYACGEVLINTAFPYEKPILPLIRLTDIDVIGASRGKSFIDNIKPHQILINESITATWNNLRRTEKGKWVMPAKTVNPKHLAPASPGIEYYGNTKPEYITYPGIKQEAISFIELLYDKAKDQARIHSIIQGTPPPNVRSGLQFAQLEEQQRRSVELTITKTNDVIEVLSDVVVMIMAKEYRPEDGRTITIFGKDKEYLTKSLNLGALKENHAFKVRNDDVIPTGKASQLSFYQALRESTNANVVPDELFIDMIDSGRFNQYTEFAGATVETTSSQFSTILYGGEPEPPAEYEDLVSKWKIVVGQMRKRSFLSYDDTVKQKFKDMLLAIENMLMEKEPTPILQEQLSMLSGFPVYYTPPSVQYADTPEMVPADAPIEPEMAPIENGAPLPEEDVLV